MGTTDDPFTRKSITLQDSLWAEVADYRFAERLASEAEAVRRLILLGLASLGGNRKGKATDGEK
jgi:hypothetical protein